MAQEHRVILVENDIYGDLRYEGERTPTVKELDDTGDTILLRSFSKTAFPGLRVGWIIAPREVTRRIADAKQWCDLHTDQLSQAVLLRFAESGPVGGASRADDRGGPRSDCVRRWRHVRGTWAESHRSRVRRAA